MAEGESRARLPDEARRLGEGLRGAAYLADERAVLTLWLAITLGRPLMLEGPAGVGKTDLARAAAEALGRPMLRLQCYEGLDEAKALYEWDYAKQMLFTQLVREAVSREVGEASSVAEALERVSASGAAFFSERFLIERPLLAALKSEVPVVLLIDEVDRGDPELEAVLLEVLGDFQATLPELGTVKAKHRPLVLLTTNGTREMTDALRRRCLHLFVDYPTPSREIEIVRLRVPGVDEALASQLVGFVQRLRGLSLRKAPSVGEAVDWARTMVTLGASSLDADLVAGTLAVLLKHEEDRRKVDETLAALIGDTKTGSR